MQIEYEIEVVLSPWGSTTIASNIPTKFMAKKMAIKQMFEEKNLAILVWRHNTDDINRLNDQLIVTFKKLWL